MDEEALKGDFQKFLSEVWQHLGLPKPTRIQNDMAKFLQHGSPKDMLEAFRGVGKTWVTAAFIVWLLWRDPNLKIMVVSASKAHADNTSTFCLQIIQTVPFLQHLAPRADQREAKVQFDVGPARPARDPSVKSLGITGQLTGSRADLILADDIETAQNSQTQMMREKLKTATEEFGAILKPGGRVIYLGTPQCEDSIYRALPAKGYRIRIWPARYPNERLRAAYQGELAPLLQDDLIKNPKIVGAPTEPERFDEDVLLSKEMEYARSGFALQFMLDTSLSDATRYPLKLADLMVMNLNTEVGPPKVIWAAAPDLTDNELPNPGFSGDRLYRPMKIAEGAWMPYTGSVLTIDPSGRGKDETGYAVTKVLNGLIYAVEWGGLIGGYDPATLEQLALIAKKQKVNEVLIESNFGDGMFTELFKPVLRKHHNCSVEEVHHTGQKEKRIIDSLEPVMNAHRLVIDRRLVLEDHRSIQGYAMESAQSYSGLYQMTRITKDRGALKKDDRLEALAMGVAHWVEVMAQDVDEQMAQAEEDGKNREVWEFMEHLLGPDAVEERTWLTQD